LWLTPKSINEEKQGKVQEIMALYLIAELEKLLFGKFFSSLR